jgi:hypothetical protein
MHGEIAARAEQESVVVINAEKRLDGDQAVTAGTVLDHYRLAAPARREPLRYEPRSDIRARSGPERHDELDRVLGPFCRLRRGGRREEADEKRENGRSQHRSSICGPSAFRLESSVLHVA